MYSSRVYNEILVPTGPSGKEGWSPILSAVQDNVNLDDNDNYRVVFRITGWSGGTGSKPLSGLYVGASGLVSNIADAVNIRGEGTPLEISATNVSITPFEDLFTEGSLDYVFLQMRERVYNLNLDISNMEGIISDLQTDVETLQTQVVPYGTIMLWYGDGEELGQPIPSGWTVCDGSNGTPNLTDRFIVGAGETYEPGNTGNFAASGSNKLYYSLFYIMKI